jgi:hypothetical protein
MGLSEALSDDGTVTGRGGPVRRGSITGVATGLGGMLHTFPFLIPNLAVALKLAYVVVGCELVAISFLRCRFMGGKLAETIVQVVVGGAIVFAIGSSSGASVRRKSSPSNLAKSWLVANDRLRHGESELRVDRGVGFEQRAGASNARGLQNARRRPGFSLASPAGSTSRPAPAHARQLIAISRSSLGECPQHNNLSE